MNELSIFHPSIRAALPHLPAAAAGLLAVGLGVQAAFLVGNLIPQPQSTAVPAFVESTGPAPGARATAQSMDVQNILNADLFGEPAAEGEPTADPVNAPQTRANLVLAGTLAMEDPSAGLGLIGETAANAKVYSVGEPVGGVRLHAVYRDRVILNRNGQLEALYMPRERSSAPPPPAARQMQEPAGMALARRVQQMVNQNPGTIADVMRPQPVFADGRQRGYRVYPGRSREQFARLGLMPGDLITAINGTPLDDPARGMEVFRTLGSASQVNVTIERGGRQQQLVLDMTQLANQAAELTDGAGASPPVEQVEPPPNPQSE